MFRYLGIISFLLLFCCGIAQAEGRPTRIKPPVRVEVSSPVDLKGIKPGDEADLTIRCHITADLEKFTLFYDKDAGLDMLSGDPIERSGVAAGDVIEAKVRVRLNAGSGRLTVFYNTYFSYGHIGDSQVITVGSEAAQ